MTLRWSALGPDCVQQWAELTNLLATVDDTGEFYGPEDLAEELEAPGVEPAKDTWAVWDGADLVAYGQLRAATSLLDGRVKVHLGGGVHPDHRGRGIGRELMARMEHRAVAGAAERFPGAPTLLQTSGGQAGASVRPLLEHRGYAIARYFHEMERAFPGAAVLEPAAAVEPYRDELSEATRLAHNDAFSTHWGSTPRDEENWRDMMSSRTFRPNESFVHVAADGRVLAYVLCYQWMDGELYVGQVGTRQDSRGRGLARATLAACLRAAAEHGYRSADLGVDSVNPTGATALYESMGFEVTRTFATYTRVLDPAG
ncbi:GNAT family N-acetyltransferase [Segeticoccus rhizosphaerae]|jgi:ribosomal protein S18 acetylase RimI-like enzyme|uniref:GNAT family N-acetyltransferase n=1 Tax=Segeticoccus rhizosphaerae TaxID=1104777 RepID=UPI001264DE54|nr:GNAT family N-acetyltransferase [Segeticoccus rhizosphaerae]